MGWIRDGAREGEGAGEGEGEGEGEGDMIWVCGWCFSLELKGWEWFCLL